MIIVDESHRSIYKKYQEIFYYFDALLLGMTATPKDEIDKNTYTIFDLERGVPTYAYELEQAVKEGYLVDYKTREYKTKIMEEGIHYDQLSEEEKEAFDDEFEDEEIIEKDIPNTAINRWLFNSDTIDLVLKNLMREGLKVEGGDKLGKTVIFARNSLHAKTIVDRFQKLFPEKGSHFIKQIDYSIKESEHLIEEFEEKDKMPQIAVSVDMLDTGFLPRETQRIVYTNFTDQILEYQENTSIYAENHLENYRKKVEFYLKEHQDNQAVSKLRNNQQLGKSDMQELERILWQELGSKEDYAKGYGDTPVGILIRKIIGLDQKAVNEAFNEFLNEEKLNANQIRFVRLIIDYIVANGMIDDKKVLMDEPFRSVGSIGQIFENNMDIAVKIMTVVDQIKQNAEVIA